MDGRLRRRARQRHGDRGHAAQSRCTARFRPRPTARSSACVVVGLEWTKNAADARRDFAEPAGCASRFDRARLRARSARRPTTPRRRRPATALRAETLPPPCAAAVPQDQDALQLLKWAFGIAPDALPPDNIENAHLSDQRTALHMMNVLWRGTFGDYLLQMWNPHVDDNEPVLDTVHALRAAALRRVLPAADRPAADAARRQAAVRHAAAGRQALRERRRLRRRDRARQSARRAAADVGARERQGAAARRRRRRQGEGHPADRRVVADRVLPRQGRQATCAWSRRRSAARRRTRGTQRRPARAARRSVRADYWDVHIGVCNDFLPDPPYSRRLSRRRAVGAGGRARIRPRRRRRRDARSPAQNNYLAAIATAAVQTPDVARSRCSMRHKTGPRCCRRWSPTRCRRSRATRSTASLVEQRRAAARRSRAVTTMPYVETLPRERSDLHGARRPKELARVADPGGHRPRDARRARRARRSRHSCRRRPQDGGVRRGRRALRRRRSVIPRRRATSGAVKLSLDYLVDAHGRRAQHRVPLDARRVLVPARRVDHGARQPPPRADARQPADAASTSAAMRGSRT